MGKRCPQSLYDVVLRSLRHISKFIDGFAGLDGDFVGQCRVIEHWSLQFNSQNVVIRLCSGNNGTVALTAWSSCKNTMGTLVNTS